MVRATVREWHEDLGWGVLESPETPDGCWTHYSAIVTPVISRSSGWTEAEYKYLSAGQLVELEWETPGQDGFDFRASSVRPLQQRTQRHERAFFIGVRECVPRLTAVVEIGRWAMEDAADRLRMLLTNLGAETITDTKGGAFKAEAYLVRGLTVHISSEYGVCRVNLSVGGRAPSPASFWLAALDGQADYPDPPVTDEDLARLIARLPELVDEAPRLSPAVVAMGKQYSKATRSRLEG